MRELEEEEEASTLCSGIRERDRTYIERGEEGESGIWLGSRKRRLNDPGCALWQREEECATMVLPSAKNAAFFRILLCNYVRFLFRKRSQVFSFLRIDEVPLISTLVFVSATSHISQPSFPFSFPPRLLPDSKHTPPTKERGEEQRGGGVERRAQGRLGGEGGERGSG